MATTYVNVNGLVKTYRVPERSPGLGAALKSLVHKQYRDVEAVRGIEFSIEAGEMVGFIGPNGAGKTTTLKMLAGLLHPTSGSVDVLGYNPWQRKAGYLRQISMVLGNKSQMLWDIPPMDSFLVLGEIYGVSSTDLKRWLDELIALLDMEELLTKPVRNFSLGERMKCELVAGLLHQPKVLFLDEPTLGLDVSMQGRLRRFFKEYNERTGVTVMLTSHYMADVLALCPRVILIHHGRLLFDGDLDNLAAKLAPFKLIQLSLRNSNGAVPEFPDITELVEQDGVHYTLRVAREKAPEATARLLNSLHINDLSVVNPPIEAVIDQIYQEGAVDAGGLL